MRMILGAATLVLLAACDGSQPVSTAEAENGLQANGEPQATRSFKSNWIPELKGPGNFEVCLTTEAAENDIKNVTLPVGTLFGSAAPLNGSVRDHEVILSQAKKIADNLGKWDASAVALTKGVHLTTKRPCALTEARAVVSDGFRYRHEKVIASDHFLFTFDGLYIDKGGSISNKEKAPTGYLGDMGVVVGTPILDIGNAYLEVETE
jgi:hypothetical protein